MNLTKKGPHLTDIAAHLKDIAAHLTKIGQYLADKGARKETFALLPFYFRLHQMDIPA
jgi:hypothetical protein